MTPLHDREGSVVGTQGCASVCMGKYIHEGVGDSSNSVDSCTYDVCMSQWVSVSLRGRGLCARSYVYTGWRRVSCVGDGDVRVSGTYVWDEGRIDGLSLEESRRLSPPPSRGTSLRGWGLRPFLCGVPQDFLPFADKAPPSPWSVRHGGRLWKV